MVATQGQVGVDADNIDKDTGEHTCTMCFSDHCTYHSAAGKPSDTGAQQHELSGAGYADRGVAALLQGLAATGARTESIRKLCFLVAVQACTVIVHAHAGVW